MTDRKSHHLLDPALDPSQWERAVDSIVARAAPELARRRRAHGVEGVLSAWIRQGLSAAATVAALAAGLLFLSLRSADVAEASPLLAEALVPDVVAAWIEADVPPTLVELADAVGEEVGP